MENSCRGFAECLVPGHDLFLERKKRARATREMKRAILPIKMRRRPRREARAAPAINVAAFPDRSEERPEMSLILRDALLPWRKNRPAMKMMTMKITAGNNFTRIV
jgi:hypothetical protein